MSRTDRRLPCARSLASGLFLLASCCSPQVIAVDLAGFYLGAGVTRGKIKADFPATHVSLGGSVSDEGTGWKAVAGIRPLSFLGGELEYVNFGSPERALFAQTVKSDLNAKAAFIVVYLPLPAALFDVYAKGGYASLDGSVSGTRGTWVCTPQIPEPLLCGPPIRADLDDEGGAFGGGVQFKLKSWAIRAEFETFVVSGPNPDVASITIIKTIP